jgi:hypothetical protein
LRCCTHATNAREASMSDVPRTTNPQISTDYIGPVLYKDLIAANRDRSIDPHSTQILDHEKTYISNRSAKSEYTFLRLTVSEM